MSAAVAVAAALASVVIVLTGVGAGVRFLWRIAVTVRDNTRVTNATSASLAKLATTVDARFDEMGERLARLEGRRRRL